MKRESIGCDVVIVGTSAFGQLSPLWLKQQYKDLDIAMLEKCIESEHIFCLV